MAAVWIVYLRCRTYNSEHSWQYRTNKISSRIGEKVTTAVSQSVTRERVLSVIALIGLEKPLCCVRVDAHELTVCSMKYPKARPEVRWKGPQNGYLLARQSHRTGTPLLNTVGRIETILDASGKRQISCTSSVLVSQARLKVRTAKAESVRPTGPGWFVQQQTFWGTTNSTMETVKLIGHIDTVHRLTMRP